MLNLDERRYSMRAAATMACQLHTLEADLYLELVSSLVQTFDAYIETVLRRDKVTVLLFNDYIDFRYDGQDVFIHIPWIVGTKLWIYRKKYCTTVLTGNNFKQITWEEYLPIGTLKEEFSICWLCNQQYILLSFKINDVLYMCASFFLLDHIRPRKTKEGICFNYFNNEKHLMPQDFKNPIFFEYPYRVISFLQILLRYLDMPLNYHARGTGDPAQNLQNKQQLWRGQVDAFISARTNFQSTAEDNNNPSTSNKHLENRETFSPTSEKCRFTIGSSTGLDLQTLKLMSLAPTNTWIKKHRLIDLIEEGLIDPSKVTETNRAGQQKLFSLGVCFPNWRETDPWEFMIACIDQLDIGEGRWYTVIEGYTFKQEKVWLPKSKVDLLKLVLELFSSYRLSVDVVENENKESEIELYLFPSYYVPVVSSHHNTKFKLTLYSKRFFQDVWHFVPTYFSLLSLGTPFYNRSNLPKVFQAITKMSSTILPKESLRIEGNKVIHHYATGATNSNLPGSPVHNPIYVKARVAFKQNILNDEDGIIASRQWLKNFPIVTLKYDRIYCGLFKIHTQVYGRHIEPNEEIVIFTSAKQVTKKYQHFYVEFHNGFQIIKRKLVKHDNVDRFILQNIIYDPNQETFLMKFSITYKQEVIEGDKFTTIHGQKVTATDIRESNDEIFKVDDEQVDVLLSVTSMKRMTIGEQLYGYIVERYPELTKYCFGEWQFHLDIDWSKENLDARVFNLYFMRLTNLADAVLTYTQGPLQANPVSEQNSKGNKGTFGVVICTRSLICLSKCPYFLEIFLNMSNLNNGEEHLGPDGRCVAASGITYTVMGVIDMLMKVMLTIETIINFYFVHLI